LGRNIQTNYDDGTFEKVEFDAWQQKNYDRNDTVVDSQWYVDRNSPDPAGSEPTVPSSGVEMKDERAAWLAAKHYDTPQVLEMDTLGRMFLRQDDLGTTTLATRFAYDLLGRRTKTTDPRGLITTYGYGLMPPPKEDEPQVLLNDSPDSGKRFLLNDVAQKPHRRWNSRGFAYRHEYDDLQRPIELWVTPDGASEYLAEKMIYGESQGAAKNHRGQLYQSFDQAGKITFINYDFKGNLTEQERTFAEEFKVEINHNGSVSYESETFTSQLSFDALNRPTKETTPDDSVKTYSYASSGLLNKVEIEVRGGLSQDAISDIKHNARGQRTDVFYANGSKSAYSYDAATFRLKRILSTRNTGSDILQDLNYTFDAVGNIVEQVDDAQQTHYFQNSVIAPNSKYEYDALYRLTKAKGREHAGQGQAKEDDVDIQTPVPHANQSDAVINYSETYEYDEIGNIEKLVHTALNNNWTRGYDYDSSSNYLLKTSMPGDTIADPLTYSSVYTYDVHGNMKSMPHLSDMIWNANDNLTEVDLGSAGTAYYRYDAEGNRIRKVIENGSSKKERLYLDGVEIWREFSSTVLQKERETLSISDESKVFLRVETLTVDGGTPIGSPTSNFRYQYANHLESACLELDSSANIISYEEYHPFGTSSYRSGDNAAEVSLKLYRYNGKERDEETGLYNYGMRYYCAWLCRFVSCDPKSSAAPNLTPYHYTSNNPINRIDPDGMQDKEIDSLRDEETKQGTETVTISKGGSIKNSASDVVKEKEKAVEEAESEYENLVSNHKGDLKKRHERKFRRKSGLKAAERSLAYWQDIESTIDDMISTFKIVMPVKFKFLDNLPINIVINYEPNKVSKRGDSNPLSTLIPAEKLEIMEYGSDIQNTVWTGEFEGDIRITLWGGGTYNPLNTKYLANEFGDIDYFFKNVKPDDPKSFDKWIKTGNTLYGRYDEKGGAGDYSFQYQFKFETAFKKYIENISIEKIDRLNWIIKK